MSRLLTTCKAIKPFLRYYRLKQEVNIDDATDLIMDKYWPEMITNIWGVGSGYESEIVKMTSLHRLHYFETAGQGTPFDINVIPDSVSEIEMRAFVELLNERKGIKERYPGWMPSLITTLCLKYGDYTKMEPADVLPTMLRSLTLEGVPEGRITSLPVGWLPGSLTHFDWDGVGENVNLDCSVLPSSLVSLVLGSDFNGILIAPQSLLHLTLHSPFDTKMFPEGLPPNLQSFDVYANWCERLPIIQQMDFPKSLTNLTTSQIFECGLPETVTCLTYYINRTTVRSTRLVIPSSVTDLFLCMATPLGENMPLLGPTITHLEIEVGGGWSCPLGFIPLSVTHLIWSDHYDMKVESHAVPALINCYCATPCLCHREQQTYVSCIPTSVTHLTFGECMVSPLRVGDIPRSVTHLTMDCSLSVQLERGVIPDSVTHLSFGKKFNQPLLPGSVSDSVQYLEFGQTFCQPLPSHVLPASLKRLTFACPQTPAIDVAHVTADIEYTSDG